MMMMRSIMAVISCVCRT